VFIGIDLRIEGPGSVWQLQALSMGAPKMKPCIGSRHKLRDDHCILILISYNFNQYFLFTFILVLPFLRFVMLRSCF